jgi:hypothetical protein
MMRIAVIAITTSGLIVAQTAPTASNGGWRRVGDPPPATAQTSQDPEPVATNDSYGQAVPNNQTVQNEAPLPEYPQRQYPQGQYPRAQAPAPASVRPYGLPSVLTMKSGAYVTVRLNEGLSTDHNQQGDPFSATLEQPIVVDGVVVANRGQTVYGRVAGVEKQNSSRPSKIALQLTSLTLADGTQTPITSQLVGRTGGRTPAGIQAGTVATTTAVGAGIGAVAGWGTGAAIGAGAGAAAGIIGVLLTRNHATVVYPETALTFQITSPVGISTERAPQAFRYVGPEDYGQPGMQLQQRPAMARGYAPGPYPAPYPVYATPYPYGYAYPYWGPGLSIVVGRGWGWGGGWGRGGYRRWR